MGRPQESPSRFSIDGCGSETHPWIPQIRASLRKLAAERVHGMMVCVLKARLAEEALLQGTYTGQDTNDDRGSDSGECVRMPCSGTEKNSDNEATACEFLHDECDEGTGTYHGAVQ